MDVGACRAAGHNRFDHVCFAAAYASAAAVPAEAFPTVGTSCAHVGAVPVSSSTSVPRLFISDAAVPAVIDSSIRGTAQASVAPACSTNPTVRPHFPARDRTRRHAQRPFFHIGQKTMHGFLSLRRGHGRCTDASLSARLFSAGYDAPGDEADARLALHDGGHGVCRARPPDLRHAPACAQNAVQSAHPCDPDAG